jgi:6-phosphogluconolactonase
MPPQIHVAPMLRLLERFAATVHEEARAAIEQRGRFALAIPGGSVVPALKTVILDWDRTHVFWVDERAVPPSSPDSNFGLAQKAWLGPGGAKPSALHRMPAENPDLTAAAEAYSGELRKVLGNSPKLDFVLLGVGPDGHVASLFPDHPALAERVRLVVPIFDSPKPPPERLTLTLPLLTTAGCLVIMAFGDEKAGVMKRAWETEDSGLPVSLVLHQAHRALVLLDEEAGSEL